MGSRRGSGILTVTIPSPMRFKKRASAFNACVGARLRGQRYSSPGPGQGGRRNPAVQAAFRSAVQACRGGR